MSDRAHRLHSSKWTGVFYITGGGSAFLSEILQEPGASKTVLEALVPYAENALSDLLGGEKGVENTLLKVLGNPTALILDGQDRTSSRFVTEPDPDRPPPGHGVHGIGQEIE